MVSLYVLRLRYTSPIIIVCFEIFISLSPVVFWVDKHFQEWHVIYLLLHVESVLLKEVTAVLGAAVKGLRSFVLKDSVLPTADQTPVFNIHWQRNIDFKNWIFVFYCVLERPHSLQDIDVTYIRYKVKCRCRPQYYFPKYQFFLRVNCVTQVHEQHSRQRLQNHVNCKNCKNKDCFVINRFVEFEVRNIKDHSFNFVH